MRLYQIKRDNHNNCHSGRDPSFYPLGNLVEVIFQIVGGVGLEFVDDVFVVRLARLVQNRLEDFALEIVVDLLLVVVFLLEAVVQFRVVGSQDEDDIEPSKAGMELTIIDERRTGE